VQSSSAVGKNEEIRKGESPVLERERGLGQRRKGTEKGELLSQKLKTRLAGVTRSYSIGSLRA